MHSSPNSSSETITPRFPHARQAVVEGGGHWLHVEYPDEVAAMIVEFNEAIVGEQQAAGWRRGFADQSQTAFADEFADDIVLEATTLAKPVEGKQQVATVLATASSIYESLEFTAEAHSGSTTYLQWRATAFGGTEIKGITVLERDARGKVVAAAIHHRSLEAVLRFSAEIRDRLAGVITADHFLEGDIMTTPLTTNSLSPNRSRSPGVARCPTAAPECGRPSPQR